ncbi:Shq1 protein [Candida orthopsilosis Co 90-125]|uniref:Shq1 protein n=1 Tax=Candida orthopsilosis (strain 90-125) TaxID=1136231 RepID=H8WYJ1_CANO9|nr:Shq1 protein [Candida orthopsilosis Co 90-125]CCG21306.1 Shq1 protein [Candida orthopsilosis Co 90-125]
MLTPYFTINQDDVFIYIDVKISHIRFSAPNIEMTVDNDLFRFSLPPYYLRLRFPYPCIDDERSHAEFDSKSECVKIKIPKEKKGQFFPDLDLTAKLLARTNENKVDDQKEKKPLIEELDVDNQVRNDQAEKDLQEGEDFNWEIKQEVPSNPTLEPHGNDESLKISSSVKYGFNNQYDGIIGVSVSNGNDINGLGDPEATPENDRIIERLIKENIQFDPEIYAADYMMEKHPTSDDDKNFKQLIEWTNPTVQKFLKWYKSQQLLSENDRVAVMPIEFSKEEQEKMMQLPRKSYLLDDRYKLEVLITIVCLLFAYNLDIRENEGEHNVESAWTIGKITPQFSFLDSKLTVDGSDNLLRSAVITCVRRALTYPLHRSFALCEKVWSDVYYILRGGKRLVLQLLLDLKELFRFHDIYYVYDKIWLEDLCAYLISDNVTEGQLRKLAHDLKITNNSVSKSDITFEKADEDVEMSDNGPEEQDEMVALSLDDIEKMAEAVYDSV